MELNPSHPTTQKLHEHWHEIIAFVLHKLGVNHVVVTVEDIQAMPPDMFLTAQELEDGLHIRFVDRNTASKLLREHGGERH